MAYETEQRNDCMKKVAEILIYSLFSETEEQPHTGAMQDTEMWKARANWKYLNDVRFHQKVLALTHHLENTFAMAMLHTPNPTGQPPPRPGGGSVAPGCSLEDSHG